nr:MAG TPA: hypothetical protein [Caudoviricetes sp.]
MVKIYTGLQRQKNIKAANIRSIGFHPTERTINIYYWNNQKETIKFDDEDHCRAAYQKLHEYIAYPF